MSLFISRFYEAGFFLVGTSDTIFHNSMKIAIQGFRGSFHEIAAYQYFLNSDIELHYCNSFEQIFTTIKSDEQTLGLMAIENTIAGSLLHNYELLRNSGVAIIGEQKLHIEHSIMCLPDDDIQDITEVNSHPVALMQCRQYLENYPNFKLVETEDTAGAAEQIALRKLRGHAAICHADVASLYGLKVLEHSIEDNKHNFTRFLVLADSWMAEHLRKSHTTDKASIVFALPHSEGSLSQILSILSFYNINLTKIQSLPIIGREWQYLFYIDVCYHNYTRYRQSIEAIRPLTRQLRILGEYKAYESLQS